MKAYGIGAQGFNSVQQKPFNGWGHKDVEEPITKSKYIHFHSDVMASLDTAMVSWAM